jgi:hypothetical protein
MNSFLEKLQARVSKLESELRDAPFRSSYCVTIEIKLAEVRNLLALCAREMADKDKSDSGKV